MICGQHILPNHRKGFCSGIYFWNRNLEWIVKIIIIFHCQLNFFPKKNLWCGQHVIYPYRPFQIFLTFPLWISFTSIIHIPLIFQSVIFLNYLFTYYVVEIWLLLIGTSSEVVKCKNYPLLLDTFLSYSFYSVTT